MHGKFCQIPASRQYDEDWNMGIATGEGDNVQIPASRQYDEDWNYNGDEVGASWTISLIPASRQYDEDWNSLYIAHD